MKALVALLALAVSITAGKLPANQKNKRGAYGFGIGHGIHAFGLGANAIHSLNGGVGLLATGGAALGHGQLISRHITINNKIAYPVPHPYPVPLERAIPVPVPHPVSVPIDRPYPVHVPQPVAVPVQKPVAVPIVKPVPYPVPHPVPVAVSRPVAVPVPKPVAYPIYRDVAIPIPHPVPIRKPVVVAHQPIITPVVSSLGLHGHAW